MQNIINALKKKTSFLSQVAALTTGTVAAQAIAVMSSPIITRLFSPSEMGALASFNAVVSILGVVAAGRYDLAIVLPEREGEALSVAMSGAAIACALGGVTFLVFLLFGREFAPLVGLGSVHRVWLLLIGPMALSIGLQNVFQRLLIRHSRFRGLAITQVLQQGTTAGAKIGIGFGPGGVGGLVASTLLGHIARLSGLVLFAKDVLRDNWKHLSRRGVKTQAKRYRKFPLISSWSGFLNTASTQLPVILFASIFSPTVAGYYALSHRILKLPIALIGQNVGQVFLERAARTRGHKAELSRITMKLYETMLIIGTAILSVVTFYGDLLFPFVFGENWLEAGKYGQWISVWLIFVFAASPLSSLFSVLERQGEGLIWNGVLLVSRMLVIFAAPFVVDGALEVIAAYALLGAVIWLAKSLRILVLSGATLVSGIVTTVRTVGLIIALQFVVSLVIRGLLL